MKTSVKVRFCLETIESDQNIKLIELCTFFPLEISVTAPPELPITFDTQVDESNLTNFTRSDANCDKTGTCYDGKINKF